MQTARKKLVTATPLLRIVKEENAISPVLAALIDTAWHFAQGSLWNAKQFSQKETNQAKAHISQYLQLSEDPTKAFSAFCQRILLARYRAANNLYDGFPLPSQWLDRTNTEGFTSTRAMYAKIKTIRESLPNYKQEIKAMAEAVLEFSEEPTIQNYNYWRNYFIEKQTPGLLTLFQIVAMQLLSR